MASGSMLQAREPIDEARVAAWTGQIAVNDLAAVRSRFATFGAAGPDVLWRPRSDDFEQAPLRFLFDHWTALKGDRPLPLTSQIDPLEMKPALGYIALLDVIDDGRDFRYRLFGTNIATAAGFDMTGDLVSELGIGAYIVEFELALHRAALARRDPVFTRYTPPAATTSPTWHRILLGLADPSGRLVRFLSGYAPVARGERASASPETEV